MVLNTVTALQIKKKTGYNIHFKATLPKVIIFEQVTQCSP
jgi:hypothetical protein